MRVVEMQDGFVTVQMHWTEVHSLADALRSFVSHVPPQTSEAVDGLAGAMEAATIAGYLQVKTGNNDPLTFENVTSAMHAS